MPKIKIDSLKEGMVVAADVKNMDDMLLIPAGATISAKHIGILQAWGLTEIDVEAAGVEEVPTDPMAELPPEVASRLTAEMKALFWKLDEADPVQMEVFRLVLNRKARRLHANA